MVMVAGTVAALGRSLELGMKLGVEPALVFVVGMLLVGNISVQHYLLQLALLVTFELVECFEALLMVFVVVLELDHESLVSQNAAPLLKIFSRYL